MSIPFDKYKVIIGLEVHAQLLTKGKAYSADVNEYGSAPNNNLSVVTLAHPGALPKANKKHFEYAIKMGYACNSFIHTETYFARKNYFYADMPKGYQITQDKTPICTGGYVTISDVEGNPKKIGITRIHMEEDSGKSVHDIDPFNTLIDLNRAGVPLIEIVTEPDFRHPQEAYNYLTEIRKIVRYLEICDGNMEEGSLRCDANVSVMLKDANEFGTKVEVKNMNSISNVKRALEYEIERQITDIENGIEIKSDTRGFDMATGKTKSQRSKEADNDYRYFPEPDLPPVSLSQEYLSEIKQDMPPMPWELEQKFIEDYNLSAYDAAIISSEKYFALFFEELAQHTQNYKAAANWMIGPIRGYLNDKAIDIKEFGVSANTIAQVIQLIDNNKLSFATASQRLFSELILQPNKSAEQLANELNLIQVDDDQYLEDLIKEVLAQLPAKVQEYKDGKKGLLGLFMGQIMKKSQGKADPKKTNQLLMKALEK